MTIPGGIFTPGAVIFGALGGVAIGVGLPLAGTAALTAVGFTGTGIAAGSIAAGIQAGIGNVVAGSLFAGAQSAGALGGFAILGPVGLIGAAVGTSVFGGIALWRNIRRRQQPIIRIHVIYPHV